MVTANSRVPRDVAGDLNAEVAGARTGAAALRRVVARHGTETFDAAVEEMFDRGEAAVRKFISEVPDGTYIGQRRDGRRRSQPRAGSRSSWW